MSRTYIKAARADSEARTRTALLDACEELFFSVPFDELTLEAVAARADVTKRTLLRHFGSKDGLMEASSHRAFERVRDQRSAAPAGDIEGAIDNLLDHYEAVGDRALKLESMADNPAVAPYVDAGRRLHYDWVATAFAPWLERDPRRLDAAIALCDVHTWALLRRHRGRSRSQTRDILVLTLRRLLEERA